MTKSELLFSLFACIVMLSVSGCDDKPEKTTHNHVYSSDTSSTTETSSTATTQGTATAPEAPKEEEPAKEDPQPKFRDRDMTLYMQPSGERCIAVSLDERDTNNYAYNVYCEENNANGFMKVFLNFC